MAVEDDTLSTLIGRFPYAQSLRIAQARKRYQESSPGNGQNTLLITTLPHWLHGFVAEKGFPIGNLGNSSTAVPEIETAQTIEIETVIPHIDDSGLVEHPVGTDYFTYEEKSIPEVVETPEEKVSLYNDDHLPYSFLWWLNKTRMEHADTYRPYVPQSEQAIYPADATNELDEQHVLDQQIRENIFHLQSPEEKLSTSGPAETIPFQIPKKTDPIIERFIREEPQIKPPPADKINLENKARKSAEDQLTLVTETLANIYVEQGLYPKAIAIYKKLSLKYPEKSTYFAARITELTNKLP